MLGCCCHNSRQVDALVAEIRKTSKQQGNCQEGGRTHQCQPKHESTFQKINNRLNGQSVLWLKKAREETQEAVYLLLNVVIVAMSIRWRQGDLSGGRSYWEVLWSLCTL